MNFPTNTDNQTSSKIILAFIGMPGAGKSEAISYLKQKNIPFVRFGQITDTALKQKNQELTEENERVFREKLRKDIGMAAYAIKAIPHINTLLKKHTVIALDGLYSWEEYIYLKRFYTKLTLIHIYAEPLKRYKRLAKRKIRPIPIQKSRERDFTEIEKLNKGGPIAIADHMLENDADVLSLQNKIDVLLKKLYISL